MAQLYRHFNVDGDLLYIGIALNHLARLAGHRSSHWFEEIRRVDIEHFPSLRAAQIAEREAIAKENPRYNLSRPGTNKLLALAVPVKARAHLHRLSPRSLSAILPAGVYADGGSLYLKVDKSGAKRWAFIYRWDGRRREMGLGSVLDVSLTEARERAERARHALRNGLDPIGERQKLAQAA